MVDITGDLDVPQRLLQTLRIRDAAPSTANPFSAGEYQDADGTVVGSYTISVPPRRQWNAEPTLSVTDVFANDAELFMRILRHPLRLRGAYLKAGNHVAATT